MKFTFKLVVLLVLTASFSIPSAFSYSRGPPTWGSVQYGNFAKSLITPDDPLVQQKLASIAQIQDPVHFAKNLLNVYLAVARLDGPATDTEKDFFGPNWMSAPEILQYGKGDCKNHAVLLATFIEALYKNSYGDLPRDLVWIMGGIVDPLHNNKPRGHVWVILNMDRIQSVSQDAYGLIFRFPRTVGKILASIGAEPPWSNVVYSVTVNFDSFADKLWWLPPTQSVIGGDNHLYVELEAYWKASISDFFYKKYPYVELHDRWNSYEYDTYPNVIAPGEGLLQLSSTSWHYGDTVSWSAQGMTPNGALSVVIRGDWGSVQFPSIITDSSGKAGFSFEVGTNIPGSGQFIVVDETKNNFLISDYTMKQSQQQTQSVTLNLFSVDVANLGKDPAQQSDLGGSITITFTTGGAVRTITQTTPFSVQADSFSTVSLTVATPPPSYTFASKWDDYYGASQHKGTTLSYNVGYTNHKSAAFFSPSSGSQISISVNSVALSSLGLDPTVQPDLHASITVTYTQGGGQHTSTITTPGVVIGVDPSTLVMFSVASSPQGYSFANQWDDYYGASQFKGATFTYNVGSSNHKTAAFFTRQQSSSLQLSSSTWHPGDTIRWSATGLTPNGAVAVKLQGSGWALQLWDSTADSNGNARYAFVVGTNIPSSGQLVVTDKATNVVLTINYSIT
jgi:hypothetical protein